MKKTLTVNLGGTVFQIDEDAYILLDNYLNNLRFHFRNEEGSDEIVRDMEMRISELFTEGLEGGQQVITIDNVEAVIARMGRPEQLDNDDTSGYTTSNTSSYTSGNGIQEETTGGRAGTSQANSSQNGNARRNEFEEKTSQTGEVKKRLFRDVDHSVLGGVLSGIAAYFGWDPTAVRIIYILLGFLPSGPSLLIIYLLLLFIIPPARTATEKLQMRGEPVNMENIGKTVTGGFDRENSPATGEERTVLQKFFDVIVSIVGVLVKVFLGILFICCIPFLFMGLIILFTLFMSVFGIVIHVPSIFIDLMPNIPWDNVTTAPAIGIFFLLSIILSVGLPLMVIIQIFMQHFGYSKPMSEWAKLSIVLAWFISLVACFVLFFVVSTL